MSTSHAASRGPLMVLGALLVAILFAATGVLWLRYGESIFVDRLLSGLANCF
ncbi:hypothetical protein [Stappia sp. ES.058]|uniref:hypothetical protein n=1 Tax=Stappia sp. ES.058 TaxID=1881061 RepID=UPI00155F9CF8|nr:hypothetical protein [Stappia sp. ES.058]